MKLCLCEHIRYYEHEKSIIVHGIGIICVFNPNNVASTPFRCLLLITASPQRSTGWKKFDTQIILHHGDALTADASRLPKCTCS
mmetsp:Transcript_8769/g.14398  ORF Transcript_8769/g.14398 Transcript_8769/m.14398 type:complete len:84 (+) Transcript_8769:37-288(+)